MTKQDSSIQCPLCGNRAPTPFFSSRLRDFLLCPQCNLVFVPEAGHLSAEEEKGRYDFHRNDPTESHYRDFLNRLAAPLIEKISPGAHGLDYGCGQTPTLAVLFEEAGLTCDNYDLYYLNNPEVLGKQYDFLSCSETMEHMVNPRDEFEHFIKRVKPGGWIGIMTQLREDANRPFEQWYYKNDKTHICFFSRKTFQLLGEKYGLHIEFHAKGVILFQTPTRA